MHSVVNFEIIKISDILPNRFQPRIKFDDESLNQLAVSIAKFGVIEPIVVRPTGKKYEIIAGERRFKASKLAGMSTIPCMVVDLSDKDSEELALLENIQRKSLSPIEEAVSYKRILDSGYITRDELSKKIGKPQSLIFSKIKLLELSDEVQNYLLNNKISEGHARSLFQLGTLNEQNEMLHRIVDERLTVKATDREIDKILRNKRKTNDDEAEILFDDERGKEKMDIDKIMQEAKDINPEEASEGLQAPNLMEAGKDRPSELLGGQENVPAFEPGRFVSVSQPGSSSGSSVSSTPSGVTFDNMFNSASVDSKTFDGINNVANGPIVSNVAVDNNVSNLDNSINNTSVVQTPLNSKTALTVPISVDNTMGQNNDSSEMSNLMVGGNPISYSDMPDFQSSYLASNSPIVSNVVSSQSAVPTSLGDIPNQQFSGLAQTVIPEVNGSISNPFEPVQMSSPDVSNFTPQSSAPVNTLGSNVNDSAIAQVMETIPEVNVSNMSSNTSDNVIPVPVSSDNDRVVINSNPTMGGQSISDAVTDAFKRANNVPDVNIYNDSVSSSNATGTIPSFTDGNIVDSSAVPSYAKVVQMLRECAEKIKNNGYYVNIQELDVDGQYKVIFTIDK